MLRHAPSALNLKFATLLDRDPRELQIQKAHSSQSFLVWLMIPKFAQSPPSIRGEFRNRHTSSRASLRLSDLELQWHRDILSGLKVEEPNESALEFARV
jgi:hypothetical protein